MDLYDEDEDVSESADWGRTVNRRMLCLVSESTVMLLHEIKLMVHRCFSQGWNDRGHDHSAGKSKGKCAD